MPTLFHVNNGPIDQFSSPADLLDTDFTAKRNMLKNCRIFIYIDIKEPLVIAGQPLDRNGSEVVMWHGWPCQQLIEI